MDASKYMGYTEKKSGDRNDRIICLPFSQENYLANITDIIDFRKRIDDLSTKEMAFRYEINNQVTKGEGHGTKSRIQAGYLNQESG